MGTYKLLLDEDLGFDFLLIAIHTSLEGYHIAYLLNKALRLNLARTPEDLAITKEKRSLKFPLYEYEDIHNYGTYHFFNNRIKSFVQDSVPGLFENENAVSLSNLLIKDLPMVDYLLKVYDEGNAFAKAKLIQNIKSIPQVVTAYNVNINQLKSKQNLIFD